MQYRRLGRSDIEVSAIGMGTWQWGSRTYWSYGKRFDRNDLEGVMEAAWSHGINFLDTAEVYGLGESERLIGELKPKDEEWIIASKYAPLRPSWPGVERAVMKSLSRLRVSQIDLYQVHFPNPIVSVNRVMKEMEKQVKKGRVRHIGVSNYGVRMMERAREALSFCDLSSNQVHYNLLHRHPEENGVVEYCKKNGITVIAYSPIEQGLLTGKYPPSVKVSGLRRFKPEFSESHRKKITPLIGALEDVANAHGKTATQVALNWLISKPDVVAIPGIRSKKHAEDNAGATGWRMDEQEEKGIESAHSRV